MHGVRVNSHVTPVRLKSHAELLRGPSFEFITQELIPRRSFQWLFSRFKHHQIKRARVVIFSPLAWKVQSTLGPKDYEKEWMETIQEYTI